MKRKPLTWIREGDCIRCTNRFVIKGGYQCYRQKGFKTRILSRIIGIRRHGESKCFRHTCDHAWCINPDHIIPGTNADNMRDRHERDRTAYGERNGRAILTSDQVRLIRNDPRVQVAIAKEYGIHRRQVSRIKKGEAWRCVPC